MESRCNCCLINKDCNLQKCGCCFICDECRIKLNRMNIIRVFPNDINYKKCSSEAPVIAQIK